MTHQNRFILLFSALLLTTLSSTFAFHSINRYFPFLERPEDFLPKKNTSFQLTPFYTTASTAFHNNWGTGRIAEIPGLYDLRHVLASLEFVKGSSFVSPIVTETGSTEFVGKQMPFMVTSKIKSVGYAIRAEQYIPSIHLSFGCWMPFAWVSSNTRYKFNKNFFIENNNFSMLRQNELKSSSVEETIDRIRRSAHDELGFVENTASDLQLGDLDLYARWNYFLDHELLMRTVNINIQAGVLIPTGNTKKCTESNQPSWAPLMGDGHWSIYLDVVPQFELKQDLKIGSIFSAAFHVPRTKTARLSVYKEPTNFSALEAPMKINPGATIKLAPFIIFENLADNLHFQARYNYVRHTEDNVADERREATVPSYLTINENDFTSITSISSTANDPINAETIQNNIKAKEEFSKWRSHYFSLQATYDLTTKDSRAQHKLHLLYDLPFGGKNCAKTHQLTGGYEVTF